MADSYERGNESSDSLKDAKFRHKVRACDLYLQKNGSAPHSYETDL